MRCPFCGHDDTQVKDSRPTDDNASIRRRYASVYRNFREAKDFGDFLGKMGRQGDD